MTEPILLEFQKYFEEVWDRFDTGITLNLGRMSWPGIFRMRKVHGGFEMFWDLG